MTQPRFRRFTCQLFKSINPSITVSSESSQNTFLGSIFACKYSLNIRTHSVIFNLLIRHEMFHSWSQNILLYNHRLLQTIYYKLYIFWKLNKWRLPYRIYWKIKYKCLENIAIVLQKYMACNIQFLCSRKWSKVRDKHCAEFLTPSFQKPWRRILISCLVCFLRPAKVRGSKKYRSCSFICL